MSTQDNSTHAPSSPQEAGLSLTPTTGLSENAATDLYGDVQDPNAAAMNENGDAALSRQLTGDVPGSASPDNPGGLPSVESEIFDEGT